MINFSADQFSIVADRQTAALQEAQIRNRICHQIKMLIDSIDSTEDAQLQRAWAIKAHDLAIRSQHSHYRNYLETRFPYLKG